MPASRWRQWSVRSGRSQRRAVGQHHDRDRLFAPALVGHADHGDLAHLRHLIDDALDFGGGDILAAGDDHVLLAVGEIEEAVVVEIADVAAAEPVAEERGCGLLGIFPVAARDLRAAQADLAVLAGREAVARIVADLDLDMGDRAAGRTDLFDLAAGLHESVAADGFGQAVGVDVAGIGEILREGANARLRRLLAAADRPLQAGDVIAFALGAGEDGGRHDRRQPRRVEPVGLDRSQALLGVEIALDGRAFRPATAPRCRADRARRHDRAGRPPEAACRALSPSTSTWSADFQ